jgi:hypothetical protein
MSEDQRLTMGEGFSMDLSEGEKAAITKIVAVWLGREGADSGESESGGGSGSERVERAIAQGRLLTSKTVVPTKPPLRKLLRLLVTDIDILFEVLLLVAASGTPLLLKLFFT